MPWNAATVDCSKRRDSSCGDGGGVEWGGQICSILFDFFFLDFFIFLCQSTFYPPHPGSLFGHPEQREEEKRVAETERKKEEIARKKADLRRQQEELAAQQVGPSAVFPFV